MRVVMRFARRYMRPWWSWYFFGTLALLATNWIGVTIPVVLAQGIDALAHPQMRATHVSQAAFSIIWMACLGILTRTLSRVLFFTPGRQAEAQLKHDLFAATIAQQPAFLRHYPSGDLFSRLGSDVNQFRLFAGFGVLQVANTILAVGFAAAQMTALSPKLTLLLIGPIIFAIFAARYVIDKMFSLMRRLQLQLADLTSWILSSYRAVQTIQAFRAEPAIRARFDTHNDQVLYTTLAQSTWRAALRPVLALATDIDIFIVLLIGGPMAVAGDLTIGELVAFITLVGFVTNPLRASAFLAHIIRQAQAGLERIEVILDHPPDRTETPPGLPAPEHAPAITLRDLHFTWPDASQPALQGISLNLPAGKTLGILGLTGSGKSTLVRLLTRLETPPKGTIFIDDDDVLDLDLNAWRKAISVVSQRPFLFSESIAQNIALGPVSPKALTHVIEQAQLQADIDVMPEGDATRVGESGVRLSGGQRQRTALARGLLRDAQLRILDDTLSAVDHATERALIEVLSDHSHSARPCTTVLIAHRVSALLHTDLVLVLDHGKMTQCDTPQALLACEGMFRDTWLRQSTGEVT